MQIHLVIFPNQKEIFIINVQIIIIIINNPNMFFAKIITQKNPFVYNKENVDETVGDVICISNAALVPTSKGTNNSMQEKTTLILKKDAAQYKIAQLNQSNPNVTLNIFMEIDENIEILVKGNGIVHVVGFFEAQHKIDHLDQIELHHLHEHQVEKKEAQQQRQKKQDKKNHQQQEFNKSSISSKENKNINEVLQAKGQEQLQQNNQQDQLGSQQELESIQDLSKDGSPLKGLQDIDDDIGDQNKQSKRKPNTNQSGVNKNKKIQKNQVHIISEREKEKEKEKEKLKKIKETKNNAQSNQNAHKIVGQNKKKEKKNKEKKNNL